MKLSLLLALGLTVSSCVAQTHPASPSLPPAMDRLSQATCPVELTSAWLTPHMMLLNSASPSSGNGVDLEFRNASGKEIRSMELSATILVKKSIYDLKYLPAIQLDLTAYGTSSVDETFTQLRHLSLPTGIHPALVQDLTLQQVTFADGSVWTGRGDQHCGFTPGQTLPVAR